MNLMDLYFSPSGRINRSTYWLQGFLLLNVLWTVVFIFGVVLLGGLGAAVISGGGGIEDMLASGGGILVLAVLVFLIATVVYWWNNYCVTVKRLHDRDKSAGWFWLWLALAIFLIWTVIVPIGVFIWALVELGFLEGNLGTNRYGDATSGPVSRSCCAFLGIWWCASRLPRTTGHRDSTSLPIRSCINNY